MPRLSPFDSLVFVALLTTCLTGCGAEIDSSASSLSKTDPLYTRANAECGSSPLLRMVDANVETICCVQDSGLVLPQLHCMQANESTVVNPDETSMLKMKKKT